MKFLCITSVIPLLLASVFLNAQGSIVVHKMQPSMGASTKAVYPNEILVRDRINILLFSMPFISCPPCVNEINYLISKLKSEGIEEDEVAFSVIASGFERPYLGATYSLNYISSNKWNFPIYIDTNYSLAKAFKHSMFPAAILLDKEAKVLYTPDFARDTLNNQRVDKLMAALLKTIRPPVTMYYFSAQELEQLALYSKKFGEFEQYVKSKGYYKQGSEYVINVVGKDLVSLKRTKDEKSGNDAIIYVVPDDVESMEKFFAYEDYFLKKGYKYVPGSQQENKKTREFKMALANSNFKIEFEKYSIWDEDNFEYSITIISLKK